MNLTLNGHLLSQVKQRSQGWERVSYPATHPLSQRTSEISLANLCISCSVCSKIRFQLSSQRSNAPFKVDWRLAGNRSRRRTELYPLEQLATRRSPNSRQQLLYNVQQMNL